jgi:hypothetical protein
MPNYLAQSAIFLPKHPHLFQNLKYEYKKVGRYNSFNQYPISKITVFVVGFVVIALLPILLLIEGFVYFTNADKSKSAIFANLAQKARISIQKTFFKPPPDDWDKDFVIIKEDIYAAYEVIKLSSKPVIIYGYEALTEEEQLALVTLKDKGWVNEYIQLETFPDLFIYITKANLKVGCCNLVVLTNPQFELSQRYGFQSRNWFNTNLSHWAPNENDERRVVSKYTLFEDNAVFNPYIQGTSIPGFSMNTILLLSS